MPINKTLPLVQIAAGGEQSFALSVSGGVFGWGRNHCGQLGLGDTTAGTNSPQHLRSLSALPLVQIAAGGEQSFALSVSGGVFGWGRNHCGQLGLGDTTGKRQKLSIYLYNDSLYHILYHLLKYEVFLLHVKPKC
uniref:Uncharacterized protein n=1 Tax=Sander lucioperca TaxID=283035 RepID=A0A8D0AX56_SANLU